MQFQKDGPLSWIYLAATFFTMLAMNGITDSSGITTAVFAEYYNETNAKAGWVASLLFFIQFLLAPLAVHTYRHLGFRRCLAICCFFYVTSFLVTPFMPNLNFVFLTYSLPFGITMSFLYTLSVITQQEYFNKYYGFAVGVRYCANALGTILMSFVLPIIIDEIGWKKTFLSLLAFTPLFLVYSLAYRSRVGETNGDLSRTKEPFNGGSRSNIYHELFQDKSFVICLAGVGIFSLTALIPLIFMVRYGVTLGIPLSKSKWLPIVRNITTLPARLIIGRMSDLVQRRGKIKLVAQIVYFLFGLLSLLCSFVRSFPLLLLYMGITGAVEGVIWVTYPLLTVEITAGYHSDEGFGMVCLVAAFSFLLGPPASGWLFDETGDFRYVFYLIFVTSSLGTILLVISSHVPVKKSLSLVEKSKNRERDFESSKLTVDVSQSVRGLTPGSILVYETAV